MRSFALTATTLGALTGLAAAFPHLNIQHVFAPDSAPSREHHLQGSVNHVYAPPTANDSRTPCPGINALANHGYIARDGKNVSFTDLRDALSSVYHVTNAFSATLVALGYSQVSEKVAGFVPTFRPIDIHELALHGKIEHDASLAHADAGGAKYAPVESDVALVQDLINHSTDGKWITVRDLARLRVEREDALTEPLNFKTQEAGPDESVLLLAIMGDGTRVSIDRVKEWMGSDRLPQDYTPMQTYGVTELIPIRSAIRDSMAAIRAGRD